MVVRLRDVIMASEQPVKKKPKRSDSTTPSDEPDFIHANDLQTLHLSIPNLNEDDYTLNVVNLSYSHPKLLDNSLDSELDRSDETSSNQSEISIPPAPDIEVPIEDDMFQQSLIKQCLCGVTETILCEGFRENAVGTILEWSESKTLKFLSNLQLLFDVYLKQNNRGLICARIVANCEMILYNPYNLVEQVISLCESPNKFVHYSAGKVLSSFLITAKTNINTEWVETILSFLTADPINYTNFNFALETIKRVVEWKDIEIHVLDDDNTQEAKVANCQTMPFQDADSFDTSAIKGLIIKSLESKWPDLITKIQSMIGNRDTQVSVLTFLTLWERIISVKANLSVIDIKPFYAHLEHFVSMLNANLPPIIWKQLLSLFNEVLCYGSTLALQDMVPEDTCQLAHLIVRYVKDYRLLDSLPFRREPGLTVNSFVGSIPSNDPAQTNVDKTLLEKMVLLVLKSVAVTVKETRSDSSDSSVGSDDFDFYQDMQLIERSIRDVLKKVDVFLKNALDFHPETPFCKIMIHLFNDQDNYLIESMVCTLDISVGISYRNAVFPDLAVMLNPVHSFIEFLKIVSHDSDVLLDYLVGSETCFLLYLLRFLKFTRRNWSLFVTSCGEGNTSRSNELDDTMTVLIRLKMQINRLVSRDLFPYNINPILRLLSVCESLYDGNEYS